MLSKVSRAAFFTFEAKFFSFEKVEFDVDEEGAVVELCGVVSLACSSAIFEQGERG